MSSNPIQKQDVPAIIQAVINKFADNAFTFDREPYVHLPPEAQVEGVAKLHTLYIRTLASELLENAPQDSNEPPQG